MIGGIDRKLCRICENWLPCNEKFFYKNKKVKMDGYNTYCKTCTIKKSKKYQQENPEVHYMADKRYRHTEKGKKKHRLHSKLKREKGWTLEWQRSESGRKLFSEYNTKRRQEKSHSISDEEWGYCRDYFDNSCAYCGMSWEQHLATYGQDLHKEHVVHDGKNNIKNCVPSCKICNSEKRSSTLNQWYNIENGKYDRVRYLRIYMWLRYDCSRINKISKIQ